MRLDAAATRNLGLAIELAAQALDDGESPFGALLAIGQEVLVAARNRTHAERNPILHAEVVAVLEAFKTIGRALAPGTTMFCSCEPCLMCLSTIYYAGIGRVVYAAPLADAIRFGSGDPAMQASWLSEQANLGVEVVQGPGRAQVIDLFERYVTKFGRL